MANRDPYIPVRDTPRIREFRSMCRGCTRIFIERPGNLSDGYCTLCNDPEGPGYPGCADYAGGY